jgi:UrcA family protein
MIDRLILANAAVAVATTIAALAFLPAGASGGRFVQAEAPSAPAQRQPGGAGPGPGVSIRLDDLDLASTDGARMLLLRIRREARALCRVARLADPRREDDCVRETTDKAVAELCSPAVAAANVDLDTSARD